MTFSKPRDHQLIGPIRELTEHPIRYLASQYDRNPVLFVHMIGWLNKGVLLPKVRPLLGIGLEADARKLFQVSQGKHLTHDLEHKCTFIKRKLFGYPFFGQAVASVGLYVQNRKRLATR